MERPDIRLMGDGGAVIALTAYADKLDAQLTALRAVAEAARNVDVSADYEPGEPWVTIPRGCVDELCAALAHYEEVKS